MKNIWTGFIVLERKKTHFPFSCRAEDKKPSPQFKPSIRDEVRFPVFICLQLHNDDEPV